MPHYAKYDVISRQKIQTEISHQQNVAAEKYKITCTNSFKYSFLLCNKNFRVMGTLRNLFQFRTLF